MSQANRATHGLHRQNSHPGTPQSGRQRPILPPILSGPQHDSAHSSRNGTPAHSPIPPSAAVPNSDAQSRTLRMHSILNPASNQEDHNGRRTTGQPEATRSVSGPTRTLPSVNTIPSPFSNQSHKVDSSALPRRGPPPGTISLPSPSVDAKHSPFSTPLAGTPSIPSRLSNAFPYPQSVSDRRGSDALTTAPPSQSNSPTTSYSSFGNTNRNSPTAHYNQQPPQFYAAQTGNGPHLTLGADSQFRGGQGQAGQSGYQLMTLDTDQGPIQVPVDVQAASKMADEKRKRNAGASARFRQRRKEKEKESTTMISKLESKLRQAAEEADFYRVERDYFRGIVYNSPAVAQVTPRMPSPRARQPSECSSTGTDWQQNGERGSEDGRNQRRRISQFMEDSPIPQAPPPQQQQYARTPSQAVPYQYQQKDGRAPPAGSLPMSGPLSAQNNPFQNGPPPPGYERPWKPTER